MAGMANGRWLTLVLAALAGCGLLPGLYLGAYFLRGEWDQTALVTCRTFGSPAEARFFGPAAAFESWVTGRETAAWVRDPKQGIYAP